MKVTASTRAGKGGRVIVCPKCSHEVTVGHFAWDTLMCDSCMALIGKHAWLLKDTPAAQLGQKGGQATSEAKTAAARKNTTKPRGKWATAIAYEYRTTAAPNRFAAILYAGKPPKDDAKFWEWVEKQITAAIDNLADLSKRL